MKKNSLIYLLLCFCILCIFFGSCKKDDDSIDNNNDNNPNTGVITDIDGNIYHAVTIGTQTWMAENLKVTHYRNGDAIPNVTDSAIWFNLSSGAYCNYNNQESNSQIYGRLYNWYVIGDIRGVCPAGWHVPTWDEWCTLVNFLGGDSIAGGKLKETGTLHWAVPNTGATNTSGFTGLPGGSRYNEYRDVNLEGRWWSSDTLHIPEIPNSKCTWSMILNYDNEYTTGYPYLTLDVFSPVNGGFSIRCVKDH